MKLIERTGHRRPLAWIAIAFLVIYCILTIAPFYFLFIRSFVATTESIHFHYWIPRLPPMNFAMTYGSFTQYYNLDTARFKKSLGISGYVSPYETVEQLAQRFRIPREKLKEYLDPIVRFNGWYTILTDARFLRSLTSTVLLSVSSILVGGFLGICTGSVLARLRKRWHRAVYNIYLLQIVIPPIMIIIPQYVIFTNYVGLKNSLWILFLLFIKGGAVSTMLFASYLSSIPEELRESVQVDGGNRPVFFFSILLPLAKVPFASFLAINFPLIWNDLLNGRVFLQGEKLTLIPLIDSFQGLYTNNFQAMYAGLAVSVIPIIILYLTFQKLFVRAALAGALKG